MKCPVCKTECNNNTVCSECGFEEISTVFISKKEGENWIENTVWPWRRNYWNSLENFTIEDTTLVKYLGKDAIVFVPYGVTEIAVEAFSKDNFYDGEITYATDREIKEVYLPDSVIAIGKNAFWACESMEYIRLSKNLTSISQGAFGFCESLKSISIPAKVNSIAEDAFIFCDKLEEIIVDPSNPRLSGVNNCIIDRVTGVLLQACSNSSIPQDGSVKRIAGLAFNQKGIASAVIPEGVVSIDGITLPDGKTPFWGAFCWCENLIHIEFPESLEYIAAEALKGCSNLRTIHIPQNVSYIGCGAFAACNSVKKITVDPKNKNYYVRNNCLIDMRRKEIIAAFGDCIIPYDGSVTRISKKAFYDHKRSLPLFIPKTITHIEDGAFESGEFDILCEAEKKPRTWNKWWVRRLGCEGKIFWNCSKPV